MAAPDIPFLPKDLSRRLIQPGLKAGLGGIADLLQRPGGLSPTVSEAINPRLAMESESIAQNFRGIRAEQAGAAARSNLPVSIKNALGSALDVAQERAQRDVRRQALTESEALRREDLGTTLDLLALLLGGKQQPQDSGAGAQQNAATIAALGTIIAAFASASRFKEDIIPVSEEKILTAVKALPVYEWRYRGDETRHVGPMAEDFMASFPRVGDSPDRIHVIDAIGALMASTKALARKVERLEAAA